MRARLKALRHTLSARQVRGDVLALHAIAQAMRARRFAGGALRLDNVKLDFTLDADGNPTEAHPHGVCQLPGKSDVRAHANALHGVSEVAALCWPAGVGTGRGVCWQCSCTICAKGRLCPAGSMLCDQATFLSHCLGTVIRFALWAYELLQQDRQGLC